MMNRYQKYAQSEKGRTRAKQYKGRNKHKVAAQNRAVYMNKEPLICSIRGCKKIGERHHANYKQKEEIIWLCRKHHLIVHGKIRGKCSWNMCERPHHAKGLCNMHYMRKLRGE